MSFSLANAEWEAAKNAEPVKEPPSQAVSVEAMAAPNTHAETYSQQVPMMPVQVRRTQCMYAERRIAIANTTLVCS